MSVEFRCVRCGKLLRTPEATSGQQAKCPLCGTVMTVPSASEAPSEGPAGEHEGGDPFGAAGASASIRPTRIQFGDVIGQTWDVFVDRWGMSVVVFLVYFAANVCVGLALAGISLAVVLGAGLSWEEGIPTFVFAGLILWLFLMWTKTGMTLFFIRVARGLEAGLGDLFAGGPYLLRVIAGSILYELGMSAIISVCVLPFALAGLAVGVEVAIAGLILGSIIAIVPAVIFALTFKPFMFLIIDQNIGILESFSTSYRITPGNRVMMLLIFLVVGFVGWVINSATCNLGAIVVTPFIVLLYAVMCLIMIGHPTAAGRNAQPASTPPPSGGD